jgi:hypothetical protein
MALNPIKPIFALAETVAVAIAAAALFVSWGGGRELARADDNAFRLPLSLAWSRTVSPAQPRIGPVLLIVAIASVAVTWIPIAKGLVTLRMVVLWVAAGVALAVIARAWHLHQLSALGIGEYLCAAAFAAGAVFAGRILRLPLTVMVGVVVLVGAFVLGAYVAGKLPVAGVG